MGRKVSAALAALTATLALAPAAMAAGSSGNPGIGISPTYQNESIGQNQPQATYFMTLTNDMNTEQAFKLSAVDFGSLNDSGGIAFLGTSSSSYAQKFGLVPWMDLGQTDIRVAAKSAVQIPVTIDNSSTLSVGGHYGAVLVTALTAPNGMPAQSRVGVLEVLSSLILLVKQGGPPPDLRLAKQSVNAQGLSMPSQVDQLFQDEGDTHVVPRGVVSVRDPSGRLVERGAMNVNSSIVLPQTARSFATPLMTLASAWLPGRYTAVTSYRYDGTNSSQSFTTSFWYAGAWYTWAELVLVIVLIIVGRWWLVKLVRGIRHRKTV